MKSALRATTRLRVLAGFLVHRVLVALGAELLHLEAIGIVAPILLGDVVALLAVLARHGDLRPYVGGLGHVFLPFVRLLSRRFDIDFSVVAGAGLEPATQRL